MRPRSTVTSQKVNTRLCNGNTQHHVMLTMFWDSRKGNHSNKCKVLWQAGERNEVSNLQKNRTERLVQGVVVYQCLTSFLLPIKKKCLKNWNFKLLITHHTAQTWHLLSGPLKEPLISHWFASDNVMKEVVRDWLCSQTTFYAISKLVNHWTKYIEKQGDCRKVMRLNILKK